MAVETAVDSGRRTVSPGRAENPSDATATATVDRREVQAGEVERADPKMIAAMNKTFDVARTALSGDQPDLGAAMQSLTVLEQLISGGLDPKSTPIIKIDPEAFNKMSHEEKVLAVYQLYLRSFDLAFAAAATGNDAAALQALQLRSMAQQHILMPGSKVEAAPAPKNMTELDLKLAVLEECMLAGKRAEMEGDAAQSYAIGKIFANTLSTITPEEQKTIDLSQMSQRADERLQREFLSKQDFEYEQYQQFRKQLVDALQTELEKLSTAADSETVRQQRRALLFRVLQDASMSIGQNPGTNIGPDTAPEVVDQVKSQWVTTLESLNGAARQLGLKMPDGELTPEAIQAMDLNELKHHVAQQATNISFWAHSKFDSQLALAASSIRGQVIASMNPETQNQYLPPGMVDIANRAYHRQ